MFRTFFLFSLISLTMSNALFAREIFYRGHNVAIVCSATEVELFEIDATIAAVADNYAPRPKQSWVAHEGYDCCVEVELLSDASLMEFLNDCGF